MILCTTMMVSLVSQSVLADCNPKRDIYEQNNRYSYSLDCHLDYGRLRKVEPLRQKQVKELKRSIEMKDIALDYSYKRIKNWKGTSLKLEKNILKLERNQERMKWIYFGLGIIVTGAAVHAAGQLK